MSRILQSCPFASTGLRLSGQRETKSKHFCIPDTVTSCKSITAEPFLDKAYVPMALNGKQAGEPKKFSGV